MNIVSFLVAIVAVSVSRLVEGKSSHKESFDILILLPFGLFSHQNTLLPIAEALVEKGHQVTFLTGLPPSGRNPKLKELNHGFGSITKAGLRNFFDRRREPTSTYTQYAEKLPYFAKHFYSIPMVKDLYERRSEFDVIIIDTFFNEFAYPFLDERPFILCNAIGLNPATSSIMGNVLNPAVAPGFTSEFHTPKSFWQRLYNIYHHLQFPFNWRYRYVVPAIQKEISAQFPNLPPLLDIEKNASLTFSQTHFTLNTPIPLLPSQIEIGGHICRNSSASNLPKEISTWIDGAGDDGVIFFSLGGVVRGDQIPNEYRDIFVEVFSKMPQRIIWKYPKDMLQNAPKNILFGDWFPQQDLLSHPNVKLFIGHGGRLGTIEAICFATPMLLLPIVGDQIKNSDHLQENGYGISLIWEDLSVEGLLAAIKTLISDPRYKKNVEAASRSLQDQLVNPLERAVWWTEYVARNQGAPLLRSPGAQLSWVEYLMLDILFLLHLVFFALWLIVKCCFGAIKKRLTKKVPSATQRKKNKKE